MAVQINVAANQAALTASIQAGVQAYNQRFAQNNPINLSINSRAFSQPLGRITGDVKDFEAALAASNARVIAFGASTAVLGGVIRSFKELAVATIEVEKNLTDINRVFGLTTSQLQKFSIELFNVSKTTATSFNDASKAALEFSRQGLKAEDTLQRTKDALTLTRLAGISTANAVDALTSTVNGFAATGVTTTQILNKLVAVEQDYAVGAGDLAEALSRTGQAAQEAGVSLDQLNALVTSAQQSTARGGAVIGNALKTIFTRLQRTETLDQLEAFNIAVRDVQGNILPAVQILQNFAGAYRGLADAQRAQLSEQVAGVYQVNILKAIVNDLNKSQGVYAGALQRGASATNEAEIATAKLNKTLDALLSQTGIATQQLATNIGKVTFEPLAKYGTEQLKSFVESLNELLEGEGIGSTFANGFLKGIRNIIAGPGAIAAFFTLFKLIQNSFSYLTQALPQIAGITTESQNRKNIEASILQILQQQGPVSQALAGTMGNQAAQAQLLLQLARQQTAEYQQQTALAKSLAATLSTQGVAVKGGRGLQVTRSGGYIPSATRMAEVVGAQAGGYSPGKVVRSPVGGVMNTAEDVKYMPGFAQPFINPPADSKAGREHRKNAINRTGVDPYMYRGFIPNFAAILDVAKDPYLVKDGDTITADATIKRVRDFRLEKIDAVESNQLFGEDATNVAKRLYPKASDFAPTINASGKAAYDRLSFISEPLVNKLIDKGYGVPDLRYTNDQSLINRTEFAKKGKKGIWSEINSRGTYTHPKVIQFLDQMGIAKSEMIEDDKKDAMYKAAKAGRKKYGFESFAGFIPNFAPAVDSARVPWFKKYSSIYRNKSTDKDVFRQKDFPTFGDGSDHYYATNGNPDMMSYLYEDFLKSALNIALGSEQVVRPEQLGFKNTVTNEISNRNPFDLTRKLPGNRLQKLEAKQSKNNQKETITQITDSKFKSLLQENPELAKNVDLMTVIFNDPRYVDPTGKNPAGVLNPFEQSISSIVKNSYADVDPNTKTKLGKVTDGLIRTYEAKKNKKFGAGLFGGFIPNFSDALGGNASLMRQALGLMPFVVDLKRGTYAEGDMFHYEIANKKFLNPETKKPIYGNLGPDDIHGSTYADTFVRGFYNASSGKVDFELTEAQKKDKNFMKKNSMLLDKVKARYADRFKSAIPVKTKRVSPLSAFRNSGFIPNFADPKYIAETLKRIKNGTSGFSPQEQQEFLSKFGAEKTLVASKQQVLMSRMLMSRMVDKLGLDYINSRTVDQLNKDVKNGYMSGALNFDVPESLRFTAARGFVPNFALPIMKGYAFNNTGKIYNDVYHSDAWDSIEGSTAGAIKYAYHNGKLLLQTNKAISPELKKNFLSRGVPESAFSPVDDVDSMMRSKNTEDIEKALKENGNIHQLSSGIKAMFQRGLYTKLIKDQQSYNIPGGLSAKDLQIFGGIDGWIKYTEKNYGPLKWNAFAKGFIPNFAYKQAVMGLEESMSGNKAIFDTKPFPHIRNSSQPTFSSAIADHGSLSNALSDSMRGQKAAGLMSGGFIPNFADSNINVRSLLPNAPKSWAASIDKAQNALMQLADELLKNKTKVSQYSAELSKVAANNKILNSILPQVEKQLLQEVKDRKKSIRNQKISSFGSTLAFAGPVAAGIIEQSVFGNRKRADMSTTERQIQSGLSTGLTAISTGASIGSAFGPLGAGIGATVGALIGLKDAIDSSTLSLDELKEKRDEEKSKISESILSAEKYLAIQEEISKSTSPKDIRKNLISLRNELSSIKDADFANKIKNAGTDINLLSTVIQEYSLKQKQATSVLDDMINVQKAYTVETIKASGVLKIKEGDTGELAKLQNFARETYNSISEFFGGKGVKQKDLARIDMADKATRERIYKENPNLFKNLSKLDPNLLVDLGNEYKAQVTGSFGFAGFDEKKINQMLSQGGLKGSELEETIATLKNAGKSTNGLGNALADSFVVAVSGYKKFINTQKVGEKAIEDSAEAVANLNQKLKDFVNNLEYSFKDLNRQNEFEKRLRGVRSSNTMLITESLYGKSNALRTQYESDIQDVESENVTKQLEISKKLLTTNIQDYYNLSDAQKTAYLELSKSFDLSKPEQNLKKIENFLQTQFGTLDINQATDKQKDYLQKITDIRKDISQQEKDTADDLAIAAEKFKEALMAMQLSRDFVFQFKAGFRDLATEGDMLVGTIGRQLPKMFADGLVDGIKAAIRESDNLGQALMGIASKFLDEISTMMMRSGIYQIVGSLAPSLLQGSVNVGNMTPVGKQKGGAIRAQSGMYISGTGSGDKYPAMLENGEYVLNRRAVMAMGGPANLDKLNFSMAPRFASGGSFQTELNDLASMESGMTTFGLENSSLYKEFRDEEIRKAEEARQKKRARQAQTAQMVGSLVAAVATIGIGAGISNKMSNVQAGKAQNLSAKLQTGAPLSQAESSSIRGFMNKGLLSPSGIYTGPEIVRTGFSGFTGYGRQTGGLIGTRLSDTIPGYMEGGLYNSPIVKKYGIGMQSGGMSPVSNNNSNTVNNSNANNSFNFNTTVNRDGTIQMGANSTSYKQQDVELSNNLNNKIYGAVLDVIRDQQRFGGSLAGTRKA